VTKYLSDEVWPFVQEVLQAFAYIGLIIISCLIPGRWGEALFNWTESNL
jgi:hypothetical protein